MISRISPHSIRAFTIWVALVIVWACFPPSAWTEKDKAIPEAVSRLLYKAQQFIDQENVTQAIELLESSRRKHPDTADRYLIDFTLGNCYLLQKKYAEANQCYRKAAENRSDFSPVWLNLAKSYYDTSRYADAAECFLKGYDTSETPTAEILYYGCVSWLAAGQPAKSIEGFERLLALHGNDIKAQWKASLVQAYLSGNQPEKALPFIEELSEISSGQTKKQWQEVRLHQYMSLGMSAKAIRYAMRLTDEYPTEPAWWKALAQLYLSESDYPNALSTLMICGYLSPLSGEETQLIADLNLALGIPLQAGRYYETLLELKTDTGIIKRLANCYLDRHCLQEALNCLDKADSQTGDPELWMLKGRILYELKRYPDAAAVFESVTREHPDMGQAWLMLGYAAWNAGNIPGAREAFNQALTFSDQKKTAGKCLKQLAER